jgi:hypothetical protein
MNQIQNITPVKDQNNNTNTSPSPIQTSTLEQQKLNTPNISPAQIQTIGSAMTMPVMSNAYTNQTFPSWNSMANINIPAEINQIEIDSTQVNNKAQKIETPVYV